MSEFRGRHFRGEIVLRAVTTTGELQPHPRDAARPMAALRRIRGEPRRARSAARDVATRSERKTAHITGESITGYFRERLAERARGEGDDAISELARDAIDEVLRSDSPGQTDFRIAKSEAVIGGKTIRTGEGVILLTGSANRDGAAFSEPDRLDIARKGPEHAAFGHGECTNASAPSSHAWRRAPSSQPRQRESSELRLRGPGPGTGAQRSCEGWNASRCASNEDHARRTREAARRGAQAAADREGALTRQEGSSEGVFSGLR